MRIGIFGGTFDPPHNAHLTLANAAMEQLKLDEVVFVPAGRNPLKSGRTQSPGKLRLEMTRIVTEGNPNFAVSDVEIARGGPSYTVDTLSELQHIMPGEYWLIMGADSLNGMGAWKAPEKIIRMARLAVAYRPPLDALVLDAKIDDHIKERIDWIQMPPSDISASEIRETIRRGRSAEPWVPKAIQQYIDKNRLYRS